jgi:hypothetical protein
VEVRICASANYAHIIIQTSFIGHLKNNATKVSFEPQKLSIYGEQHDIFFLTTKEAKKF